VRPAAGAEGPRAAKPAGAMDGPPGVKKA